MGTLLCSDSKLSKFSTGSNVNEDLAVDSGFEVVDKGKTSFSVIFSGKVSGRSTAK